MNIKSRLLSTVAAVALVTGFGMTGARAADIIAEPAAYDWTGFYFGAHVGYGEAYMDGTLDGDPSEDALRASKLDLSDVVGGVHLGYNKQMDKLVVGLEGDFTWVGLKDHVDDNNPPSDLEENDHINGNVDLL